jgi:hypothetical protein
MRVSMKFLMAAALVVPTGFVAAGVSSAGAAGGTSCAKSSGLATFKPALPIVGSSQTVKPKITGKNSKLSSCSGGGVTSATFNTAAKFNTATNCQILLSGDPSPKPPTGTITTTWNTGDTSTAKVTLQAVSGQATQSHITGKITAGLFKGSTLNSTISFAPKKGNCTSTPLASVTFTQVGATTIS